MSHEPDAPDEADRNHGSNPDPARPPRTAEHLYAEAVALLNEAARIAAGEGRDAPPVVYLTGPRYYTPPDPQPTPLPSATVPKLL